MPRKMINFDAETLSALEELEAYRMATLQDLADEAFNDLLRKHGRPVGLHESLKASASPESRVGYHTPPRPRGARSVHTDPRPDERPSRDEPKEKGSKRAKPATRKKSSAGASNA